MPALSLHGTSDHYALMASMVKSVLWLVVVSRTAFAVHFRGSDADSGESGGPHRLELHMMKDRGLNYDGAVCLDGTDAGFYFAKAMDKKFDRSWQIVFEGGGWCFNEEECAERTKTGFGSSTHWTKYYRGRTLEGFLSHDCDKNPTFCNFNRVVVPYCDGTSFTGNREDPVMAGDKYGMPVRVFFRGKRIRDALMDTLFEMGLNQADTVVLTGWSAGALSTILHADYVHDRLKASAPNLVKFRAVPLSGFFLSAYPMEGKAGGFFVMKSRIFNTEMVNMFNLANSVDGLSRDCVQHSGEDSWQCVFAPHAYKFVKAPTFIVNSGVDQWQIAFVLAATSPREFRKLDPKEGSNPLDQPQSLCYMSEGFQACGENEVNELAEFQKEFEAVLATNAAAEGHGAFIHSCPLHVEALESVAWNTITVNHVTMQEALYYWWNSDGKSSTKKYTTLDCHLHTTAPYACNPTCPMIPA